jgi:molybdenum cofactor cytidylyltransferase
MNNCGIVLLAAGGSARLGQAKQLLLLGERSLFQHSLDIALGSKAGPIVAVYGANAEQLKPQLSNKRVHFVYNAVWEQGIASSISVGLSTILNLNPNLQRVIFMVCDQPFVTTSLLNKLIITNSITGKRIVASFYEDTWGTPTLFTKTYFKELLELKGDEGARSILRQNVQAVAPVAFPMGHIDIDTQEDYRLFNILNSN